MAATVATAGRLSPRARVTTRIMEHARWIAEERRLWEAMMATHHIEDQDGRRPSRWRVGIREFGSRDQAEAWVLAQGWHAYQDWIRH